MGAAALTVAEGNLVAGEERARKALALGELAGQPDALRIFGEFRALARLYQGRGDAQLIELSRQATSMFPRMAIWPASTAQYEAHFGNQEVGRKLLADAVESGLEQVGWDTLRLVALSFYADAASRLHAADAAALVHELMSPWDDQVIWGGAQAYGHVRLWLGVAAATMGRDDEADEAFAFACRFHDDNGLMLWSARSHLGWAEALADRGERAQAQEHACSRARARAGARLRPDRGACDTDHASRSICKRVMPGPTCQSNSLRSQQRWSRPRRFAAGTRAVPTRRQESVSPPSGGRSWGICTDAFQATRGPDGTYVTAPLQAMFTRSKRGFYHDGRYATLADIVNHYDSCFKLGLSAQQNHDLVEYLKSR